METKKFEVDVIQLIKEIKKADFSDFNLELGDLKISITSPAEKIEEPQKEEVKQPSQEDIREMQLAERGNIVERIHEYDDEALQELDYLYPEMAGQLRRDGMIEIDNNTGAYKFTEKESQLDAQTNA